MISFFNYTAFLFMLLLPFQGEAEPTDLHPHGSDHIPDPPSSPYLFEENKGQFQDGVFFRARMGNKLLYLEDGGLMWHFIHPEDVSNKHQCHGEKDCQTENHTVRNHAFRVNFLDGQNQPKPLGLDSSHAVKHYIRSNDRAKWATQVHDFKKAYLDEVYPGIQFRMFHNGNHLKYEFHLDSEADHRQIQLEYEGVDSLFVDRGRLHVYTSIDTIVEERPVAYQIIRGKKKHISCDFRIEGQTVSFDFDENYQPGHPTVIDPELIFSSYSGSTADNWGMTATPGPNGTLIGAGIVFDVGYPTTMGAFDRGYEPGQSQFETDIGISKFTPDGRALEYATYLGGGGTEVPHSIIANNRGELVILGTTASTNFPLGQDPYQQRHNGGPSLTRAGDGSINGIDYEGGSDIFVAVLSEDGSDLVAATFMGGTGTDGINNGELNPLNYNYGDQLRGEVIVDDQDNIYVASSTQSSDFPTSPTAIQRNLSGGQDACLFSLDRLCENLRFSTYLGGGQREAGYSLKRLNNGRIVMVGGTTSPDFPTTSNAHQRNFQGGLADGFMAIFNQNANFLLNASYNGTSGYDQIYLTALSNSDEIYITGQTDGSFPISSDVYANTNSGQFIQRVSPDLSDIDLSTTYGTGSGSVDISPTALMIDTCERVFVSGWGGITNNEGARISTSTTTNLPISSDAYQTTTDGSDFYFLVLERDFDELIYATFFGSNALSSRFNDHVDGGTSRFSDEGVIYQAVCAGCGSNNEFPTTPRAWSPQNGSSNCNLGAIKFDFQLSRLIADAEMELDTFGCAPYDARFLNRSIGADNYFWDFGDGETSTEVSPTHQYDSVGTYEVTMIASSNSSCLEPDTLDITIETILAEPPNSDTLLVCGEPFIDLSSGRMTPNAQYQWNTGANSQTIRATSSGIYSVTATESNCVFIDSFDLTLINPDIRLRDTLLCGADQHELRIDGRAENPLWSTGETGTQITVEENGLYTVDYSIGACDFSDTAGVGFATIPEITILGEEEACEGETVTLSVEKTSPVNISQYIWSTGERTPTIDVTETGTYSLQVISDSSCVYETEKFVNIIPSLPPLELPDTLLCRGSTMDVDLSIYQEQAEIIWGDGSNAPTRSFDESGSYSVRIQNQCETLRETFELDVSPFALDDRPYYIPNAFTPNGDGINDIFKIEPARELEVLDFKMEVFDRWGNRVFQSFDHEIGWDGWFDKGRMNPGTFAYTIEIEFFVCETPQRVTEKGDITILLSK